MFGFFSKKCTPAVARDNKHLRKLVLHAIGRHGPRCNLGHIDVSNIEDFSCVFANTNFDGDVSMWDVSNALRMAEMFSCCPFNGNISQWNVARVENMDGMFFQSGFQGDLSQWDVGNVKSMNNMFAESVFNANIAHWNVSKVSSMAAMFMGSVFNGDISQWDVARVTDMSLMFHNSEFKGDVSRWDLRSLKHATQIFDSPYFESDLPSLELGALITGSSLVSAAFRGNVNVDNYAGIRKMFPNAMSAYNYLGHLAKSIGTANVHIDYVLHHTECPTWLDSELFAWVKKEQSLCKQMGLNASSIFDVVRNHFQLGGSKASAAESIPFEFEAVRETV